MSDSFARTVFGRLDWDSLQFLHEPMAEKKREPTPTR